MQKRNERGLTSILGLFLGLIELWLVALVLILGTAFVLGVLGANPDASFAAWIFERTDEIMQPFNGLFEPIELDGSTEIETSLLFAMFVYGVLAAVVAAFTRRVTGEDIPQHR